MTELKKVINIDYWLELKDRDDRQVTEDLHVLTQLSQEAQECLARGSIPDDVMKEKVAIPKAVYCQKDTTYFYSSQLLKLQHTSMSSTGPPMNQNPFLRYQVTKYKSQECSLRQYHPCYPWNSYIIH